MSLFSKERERELKTALETEAIEAVVGALKDEGHRVAAVRRPETEPHYRPELHRRVDAALQVDGSPTAIEVVLFTPSPETFRVIATINQIWSRAQPAIQGLAASPARLLVVSLRFSLDNPTLANYRGAEMDAASLLLADEVAAALGSPHARPGSQVPFRQLPEGIESGAVSWAITTHQAPMAAYALTPRNSKRSGASAWLSRTMEKKRDQHAGWGNGILAVVSTFEEREDIEAALAALGHDLPWAAVYHIDWNKKAVRVWPTVDS